MGRPPKYPVFERFIDGETLLFKKCTKCDVEKQLNLFVNRKGALFGKGSWCISCESKKAKALREQNKEYHKVYYKKYCKENIEKERLRKQKYYESNKERLKPVRKRWVISNRDKMGEYNKRWRLQNKEISNAKRQRRLAIKSKLQSNWSNEDVRKLLTEFENKCFLTGGTDCHIDHFVALSTGHCGTYKGNMILLDKTLNMSKGSENPFKWIEKFPYFVEGFKEVVSYLSEINGMSISEYEDFVNWCYENRRSLDEINTIKSSKTLWMESKEASE